MGKAIGIDLGTSACSTFAVADGKVRPIPSRGGQPHTPCWVSIETEGQVLVGHAAQRRAALEPMRTAFGLKRLLGRKFHSPAVRWLEALCPYSIVPGPNGDAWVSLDGVDRAPQALLAHVLADLHRRAEEVLDDEVDEVVLAVPGIFDLNQRRALEEAVSIAQLPVSAYVDDNAAAALAFVQEYPNPRAFVVADLGGGSFDISLFRLEQGLLHALATSGDSLLGGSDFDRRLVELLVNAFFDSKSVDLAQDPTALQRLWQACRRSKQELSAASVASPIDLPHIAKVDDTPIRLHHAGLGRELLEQLGEEELDRLAQPCAWVMEDSALGTDDFAEVVLLGAASRVVAVEDCIGYLFRQRPRGVADPKSIVAEGAALHAGVLRGEIDAPRLVPVASHSVGIKVRGGRYRSLIERNTPLPTRLQRRFTSATDGSHRLQLEVYQGEGEMVTSNAYIGRLEIEGRKDSIEVAFALDESGRLILDTVGGNTDAIHFHPASGMIDERIEAAQKEVLRGNVQSPPSQMAPPSEPPPLDEDTDEGVAEIDDDSFRHLVPMAAKGSEAVTFPSRARHHSLKPPPMPRGEVLSSLPAPPEDMDGIDVPVDSLVGVTLGGRYVVEGAVAEGGMGRVYRARHDVLGRTFAIKVLHAELASNQEIATRFVREAQAASAIDSPHVIDISDFGTLEDGAGYFVMEYLEGPTLAQLIRERGRLDEELVKHIALQLTDGLAAAHAQDIVHRDLKPENVTLIKRGIDPHFCKILDFGIAKSPTSDSNKRLTIVGALMGTPHYMAPEQIDSNDIDERTDLYALGAVLYEMVTGLTPFESDTLVGLLVLHKTERPVPPRERVPDLPISDDLELLILELLEKSPAARPASAGEVRQRLEAL